MRRNSNLEDLVKGCIGLSRESQQKFFCHFYTFCFRVCITYCETSDDAREVVNDGFLKVFKELKNFTARYENFELSLSGWIKRIMIHTAIDHYRKNKSLDFLAHIGDNVFEPVCIELSAVDKLSYDEIIKLIQCLPSAYRIVFSLSVIHGFKHEEIAKELKISIGASKSNLFKARMNIQKMILSGSMAN